MSESPELLDPADILTRIDRIRDEHAIDWARLKGGRDSRAMERRVRVGLVDIEFWMKAFRTLTRTSPNERAMAGAAILARWKARLEAKARKSLTSAEAKRPDGEG